MFRLRPRATVLFSAFTLVFLFVISASTVSSNAQEYVPVTRESGPHVSVTPLEPHVISEGKLQFTALVENTSNTEVVWFASAGEISKDGLFVAPKVTSEQSVRITAISAIAPASHAIASVTVVPAAALKVTTSNLSPGTTGSFYQDKLQAQGGLSPYEWNLSSGSLPTGLRLSRSKGVIWGMPSQTGTFAFAVTVDDADHHKHTQALTLTVSSATSTVSGGFDGPAELPRVYLSSTMADTPAPGSTINVAAGGDLQSALNNASCGQTIALQAGTTFGGVFRFPQKSCDDGHWIIVRTSAPDSSLPAEGTRITPCYAGVESLPGRPSFNCTSTQNVMAKLIFTNKTGFGPVVFESGANHYRLVGLEITRSVGTSFVSDLITPDNKAQADHIVVDRSWIHGTAQDETTRGVFLSGVSYASIIDSFFTDFHCISITGSCTDSQAIGGGGGGDIPSGGTYKIVDNFLEAAGESILFGGGAATTTPTDMEIRQNHLFKPLLWMSGQPGFVGGADGHPFIVKNNLELKNAQRVLFEGNVVEYTWGGFSQAGYSIALTPKNQAGADGANLCPICLVTDITIRYSKISHAAAGINLANAVSDNGAIAAAGGHYSIHDITIDDINGDFYFGGGPLVLVLNGWTSHILGDITINHITGFADPEHPVLTAGNDVNNPKMANFIYTNNLVRTGIYPVWSSGGRTNCAFSAVPVEVISNCFQPYSFLKNAIIGSPANYPPARWPALNFFPADPAVVQFVNYNGGVGGDYRLLPTSPYKNAGTDGKDLGADIEAIAAATAAAY
jgi:hypothetical protein